MWDACPQTRSSRCVPRSRDVWSSFSSAPTQLYSDCVNVFNMQQMPPALRLSPKPPYAGLVMQGRALGEQRVLGCDKVKVHLFLDEERLD